MFLKTYSDLPPLLLVVLDYSDCRLLKIEHAQLILAFLGHIVCQKLDEPSLHLFEQDLLQLIQRSFPLCFP